MKWPHAFAPLAVLLVSCSISFPDSLPKTLESVPFHAKIEMPWRVRFALARARGPIMPAVVRLPNRGVCTGARGPKAPGAPFNETTWMLLRGEQTGLVEAALPGPDAAPACAYGNLVTYARNLLVSRPDLFGVRDPSTLVLRDTDVDDDGTTNVRFDQVVAGGRVLESDVTVRIFPDRSLRAVNGSLRAIRRVLPAKLTAEQALTLARAVKTDTCGKFRPISAELVVEQEDSTDYILNYNVDGATADGPAAARVNARTGEASFAGLSDFTTFAVIGQPRLPCP